MITADAIWCLEDRVIFVIPMVMLNLAECVAVLNIYKLLVHLIPGYILTCLLKGKEGKYYLAILQSDCLAIDATNGNKSKQAAATKQTSNSNSLFVIGAGGCGGHA